MSSSSSSPHPSTVPVGASKTILLIADLMFNGMLLDYLTNAGWEVEFAVNNDDVLALVKAKSFDLIITSETTSGTEDVDLLRRIRAVRPHSRMVVLTNRSTTQNVIAALRQHAFAYFSTPYSFEVLTDVIRQAMEQPCWDDGIEVVSATPVWIRLLLRCDIATADRMMLFFQEMVDLPEDEKSDVAYAFREMMMNAMRHGAKFDPSQFIEISYVRAKHMLTCRVKDPGQGFAFADLYHAAISNPLEDPTRHLMFRDAAGLPPGGYGILLSRHLVDELIHNEQGNEVLLVKYLKKKDDVLMS